jgi:polyisoprenoid-binding protein YceI
MSLCAALVLIGCKKGTDTPTSSSPPSPPSASDNITPANTKIDFVGTKKGGKHDGGFKQFSGSVTPTKGDFTASKITLEIDTESLWSDNPKLTQHLMTADFFEVKKYPKASFTSTKIEAKKEGDATHVVTGDFTLHGTTKPISIPVKVTETDDTLTLESTFTFDRTEYGIAYAPDRVDKAVTVKVRSSVPRK